MLKVISLKECFQKIAGKGERTRLVSHFYKKVNTTEHNVSNVNVLETKAEVHC